MSRKLVMMVVGLGLLGFNAALACSPAPSCWIEEGPAYLKEMCRQAAKDPNTLKYVEEPKQIGRFIGACAKLRIAVKRPRG
jgi:hypothetical protein